MKKLLSGGSDESPLSRLPRGTGGPVPKQPEEPVPAPKIETPKKLLGSIKPKAAKPKTETKAEPAVKTKTSYSENRFLPTFWTVASVISMLVNIGVVIALIVVIQLLGGTNAAIAFAQSQANGLLGGLHENFVKMDNASIKTTIHVEKDIPVQFSLNVTGSTNVTLSDDVAINGALVTVNTGGLNINNARANIVLPAGTVLPIVIDVHPVVLDAEPAKQILEALDTVGGIRCHDATLRIVTGIGPGPAFLHVPHLTSQPL